MDRSNRVTQLQHLLKGIDQEKHVGDLSIDITGITYNSKEVKQDFLFVAIKGGKHDGHDFVFEAIRQGAKGIIAETAPQTLTGVTWVQVPNSRKALAVIAANFWDDPSSGLTVVGITGTNGKTTTSYLVESMVRSAGYHTGVIGTINYRFGNQVIRASHTTPESLDLQRVMAQMTEARVSHVIMEVSSHALDQNRVAGVCFDVAVFTNLTPEHLDYHGTMERYAQSKGKLFSKFLEESQREKGSIYAVLNQDDPQMDYFRALTSAQIIRYGMERGADITIENPRVSSRGIAGLLKTPRGDLSFEIPLVGRFNLHNLMAAVGTALALDINLDAVASALRGGLAVPGRMERVGEGIDYTILVDYAHTPDALEKVLSAIREFRRRRIITVFGCGGDRDRIKRPIMGEIAARLSDIVIITSDNPRTELPETIISEIEEGVRQTGLETIGDPSSDGYGRGYLTLVDRKEAIERALRMALSNDIVLVAGKGHEDYQILGKQTIPFDDRKEILEAIKRISPEQAVRL